MAKRANQRQLLRHTHRVAQHKDAECLVLEAALSEQGGREALRLLLKESRRPTVVVCGNDNLALGLMKEAMNAGMEHLKPLLVREGIPTLGKIVLGSVQGDLHDIGKNLVGVLLKGAGFEVIDLGNDVPPERFVEAATQHDAPVIGMSALLTTTMPVMGRVVSLLKERGLAGRIKTIIGGAPVTDKYAREIGADAHGYDAANAVDRVKALLGAK